MKKKEPNAVTNTFGLHVGNSSPEEEWNKIQHKFSSQSHEKREPENSQN